MKQAYRITMIRKNYTSKVCFESAKMAEKFMNKIMNHYLGHKDAPMIKMDLICIVTDDEATGYIDEYFND